MATIGVPEVAASVATGWIYRLKSKGGYEVMQHNLASFLKPADLIRFVKGRELARTRSYAFVSGRRR
jgi:hypothetical protein